MMAVCALCLANSGRSIAVQFTSYDLKGAIGQALNSPRLRAFISSSTAETNLIGKEVPKKHCTVHSVYFIISIWRISVL